MKVAVLPGDGIGAEVTNQAVKALRAVGRRLGLAFETTEMPVGWSAIDECGQALPPFVREACRQHDAIFLGAVGLPDRDRTLPQEQRPERAALLALREGNFANLRPIWLPPCMAQPGHPAADMLIFRELNAGIYMGGDRGRRQTDGIVEAFDTMRYSVPEIERIAHLAFQAAMERRKQLCSIDKANILATSALWRETVETVSTQYPEVSVRHHLVDSAAPAMIQHPEQFDVLLTENLFGDILSDLGGVLAGSLGMLPTASIGGDVGLFEPAHGSAPDIMGRDIANPIAAILTMAMLLEYGLDLGPAAHAVRRGVLAVLEAGSRTVDIMADGCTQVGTTQFGDLVVEQIERS
ncbi:MAG TPA: 3-isopropylmalate dehydrogenase [Phycisphaerae bacterium]|nr:3-isopropylmalate dehydrogenase [Phycisphaerae bacterium]